MTDKREDFSVVYISGPISEMPDHNRQAFAKAQQILISRGIRCVNPHDLHDGAPDNDTWENYMRRDIKALMDCDKILMLDGWGKSRGALLEGEIALRLGMEILYEGEGDILRIIGAQTEVKQ